MQPTEADLTNAAVHLLRQGQAPDAVHGYLLQLGAHANVAHAIVENLLVLKRQADAAAALDPQRLRAEASAMIEDDEPYESVLEYMTSVGVAEEHARPELDRLYAAHAQKLASMRPCDRCGTPTAPSDSYFDRVGNQVCGECHGEDNVAAAEWRVEEARLEAAGVAAHHIQQSNAVRWCPRCQDHSAVLVAASYLTVNGLTAATNTHRCTRCGQNV